LTDHYYEDILDCMKLEFVICVSSKEPGEGCTARRDVCTLWLKALIQDGFIHATLLSHIWNPCGLGRTRCSRWTDRTIHPYWLMIRYSYGNKNIVSSMASPIQHCFRISGILAGWTELDVVCALKSLEPAIIHDDQHPRLSLYPACAGLTQTGLLKLENCLEFLEKIKSVKLSVRTFSRGESATVDIDDHFYDLTPLNTPGNEPHR
jgi:hypothetical protein